MSLNKKIWFGDNYRSTINDDIFIIEPADLEAFRFDSTLATMDSTLLTFDYSEYLIKKLTSILFKKGLFQEGFFE